LFIASVLSKPVAVTLPVLLIVIDWYRDRKLSRNTLLEKIPFLFISIFFGILTIVSQKVAINSYLTFTFSWFDKPFLVSYAFAFYIVKLIVPIELSAIHYYPASSNGVLPWEYYASLAFLLIVAWLVIKQSSLRKELLFGSLFFLVCISLMVQILPVGVAIASERYSYVSYIGLFYIIGQWIASIERFQIQKVVFIVFALVITLFSAITFLRIGAWKNGIVLFTDIIEKNPRAEHAWWGRGTYKNHMGDKQGAIKDLTQAIACNPSYLNGYNGRAEVYLSLSDFGSALNDYNSMIRIRPGYAEAYNSRALLYEKTGDISAAMKDYNIAIKLQPDLAKAYDNRGLLKANTGDLAGAMDDLNTAIKIVPDYARAYCNRAYLKKLMKDFKGSIEDFDRSIVINPGEASVYYNRSITKFSMGDQAGACNDLQQAQKKGDDDAAKLLDQYCR